MKKPKVAIIGLKGLPAWGGAATVGESLINELKDEYDFIVYSSASHANNNYPHNGYNQIVFKKLFINKLNIPYYYLASAFHSIIKGKYSFVHLHHIAGSYILPLLKVRYKVISTSHGVPQKTDKWENLSWFFKWQEKLFFKFSDIITSVSYPLKKEYAKRFRKTVYYIPNGVYLNDVLQPQKSKEMNILFAAGRIMYSKGCHIFLKALKNIKFSGQITIIGDLNQVPFYDKHLHKLSDGLNVKFTGLVKDKSELVSHINSAKLFVFPSQEEAMSMMLLEVASYKIPIICSNIQANKAIFTKDEVLYFNVNDEVDLAKKITWALENKTEMQTKAEMAFRKLLVNHQWKDIADRYNYLYKSLLCNYGKYG